MYENLIETLRFCAKNGDCHDCPNEKPCAGTMGNGLYCEAADAIEVLSKQRSDDGDWWAKARELEKMLEMPRWIPVTEWLPEKDTKVLAYYGFDHGDGYLGMMFMQVLDYYANDPEPHFQHEGTNGLTVTHWMPLPEPPKEET